MSVFFFFFNVNFPVDCTFCVSHFFFPNSAQFFFFFLDFEFFDFSTSNFFFSTSNFFFPDFEFVFLNFEFMQLESFTPFERMFVFSVSYFTMWIF